VIEVHKRARVAFGKAIDASGILWGVTPSNAAERRCDNASRAEKDALVAVCAFRPLGRADAKAKAEYLMDFALHGELQESHIIALVNAGVRS
jgi:hypothetical protein